MKELDPNQGCAADVSGNMDTPQMNDQPSNGNDPLNSLELPGGQPENAQPDITAPPERGRPEVVFVSDREARPAMDVSSPDEITARVKQLGEAVAAESVVVGSSAAYMALSGDIRSPRDIDLAVSPEAYAYLREQEGWQERQGQITNGAYDVGTNWGDQSYEGVKQRSWQTEDGVRVASLSDITDWKNWHRGEAKDLADVQNIRDRLLDPTKPPLSNEVIADEIAIARSCLPEHLRHDPNAQVAVELTANGLATVRALYGDDRIGRPQPIIGDLEQREYGVAATYHNGFDLPEDMQLLQRHMGRIGASDDQRLEAMVADAYSDSVYGNGRRSDNPEGYDELRSANLLGAHAAAKGYDPAKVERHRQSVLGTGFDERTGQQAGRHHPDPVVRAVAGVDLQVLSEPESASCSVDLAIEDGISARFSPARTIGQAAMEQGVRISSTADGLRFVDEYPDLKPAGAPDGPTLREAFGQRLAGNAGFADPETGYTYPDGWTLENRGNRAATARVLREMSSRVLSGDMTAGQAYQRAEEHRRRLS
jgi:hypothetical protein